MFCYQALKEIAACEGKGRVKGGQEVLARGPFLTPTWAGFRKMLWLEVIVEEMKTGVTAASRPLGTRIDISPATERRATRQQGSEIKLSGVSGLADGDGSMKKEEGGSIKRNINQLKHIHFLLHSRFYQKKTLNFVVLAAAEI